MGMRTALTALVAIATMGCKTSGASADAGDDSNQPICILQEGGSTYVCTGGETSPACPSNAESLGTPCSGPMAFCMGCDGVTPSAPGAGFSCTCQAVDADAGPTWRCVGTEHLCK